MFLAFSAVSATTLAAGILYYTNVKYIAPALNQSIGGIENFLDKLKYDTSKLQHEFKHASDFGVNGNWSSANGEVFKNALNSHARISDIVLKSTYRGSDVIVYINSVTGNGTYYDLSGNFIGGWKFSAEQLQFHIKNGISVK